jgi:hypothetical protein
MPPDFSGGILFLVDDCFEPKLTDAAWRTNVSYSASTSSRLTNTKISITAMNKNTAPTIHATGVE